MELLRDRRAIALLLAASLTILSNATIGPALPGIEAHFSETPRADLLTRLLVTAPALLVALCAPFAGLSADRFGRRRQLLMGVGLFGIAGSIGLVLPSLPLLLASRLLLGLSIALVMTAQTALIGDIFAERDRGRFMGLQIAATNVGGFVFIALAGWLAEHDAFLVFAIYGIGLLYLPFLWRVIPGGSGSADGSEQPDADTAAASHWQVQLGLLVLLAGLTFVLFYTVPTQLPYYLDDMGEVGASATGVILGAVPLTGGVAALAYSSLRRRLGRGGTPALGFTLMALGFWLLQSAGSVVAFLGVVALIGGGFGCVMPGFITNALDLAPAARRGVASGAITMSIFMGQFLSPLATQPLVGAMGYPATFRIASVVLLGLALFVALGLRQPTRTSVVPA